MIHQWIWDILIRNLKVEWAMLEIGAKLMDGPFELTDGVILAMDLIERRMLEARSWMSDVSEQLSVNSYQ
ncbi:hypothetical protein [Flagellimonas flava]|uniref:hypothetical protein n=1 Tax=Flagellimonas flava TaxID=570519 RepID=UPI003D6575E6